MTQVSEFFIVVAFESRRFVGTEAVTLWLLWEGVNSANALFEDFFPGIEDVPHIAKFYPVEAVLHLLSVTFIFSILPASITIFLSPPMLSHICTEGFFLKGFILFYIIYALHCLFLPF